MGISEVFSVCDLPLVNLKGYSVESETACDRLKHPVHSYLVSPTINRHRVSVFVVKRQDSFAHEELIANCREPGMVGLVLVETDFVESVPGDVECCDSYQTMVDGVSEELQVFQPTHWLLLRIFLLNYVVRTFRNIHLQFFHKDAILSRVN